VGPKGGGAASKRANSGVQEKWLVEGRGELKVFQ